MKSCFKMIRQRASKTSWSRGVCLLISRWEMSEFVCDLSFAARAEWPACLAVVVPGRMKNSYMYEN